MQRKFVEFPQVPAVARRVVQFVHLDRQPQPKRLQAERTRGDARVQQFLRIARGRTV